MASPAGAEPDRLPSRVSVTGIVQDTGADADVIWFEIGRVRRFTLHRAATRDPQAVIALLKDSRETNRSLVIAYDPASGDISADPERMTFEVRGLNYKGRQVQGSRYPAPPRDADADAMARRAVAVALAWRDAGEPNNARRSLDEALASGRLSSSVSVMALKARSGILAGRAEHDLAVGPEGDRLLVAALADLRLAGTLVADDVSLAEAEASLLNSLGAYEEALAANRRIVERWPDRAFWSWIRIGVIYRSTGQYDRALAALDKIPPEEAGMAYHYHRGWTLAAQGLEAEAVLEFSEGLEGQPDYPWALVRRGCSRAALGATREALSDERAALRMMHDPVGRAQQTLNSRHDEQWLTDLVRRLTTAVALGTATPMPGACEGLWANADAWRERSNLLPTANTELHAAR